MRPPIALWTKFRLPRVWGLPLPGLCSSRETTFTDTPDSDYLKGPKDAALPLTCMLLSMFYLTLAPVGLSCFVYLAKSFCGYPQICKGSALGFFPLFFIDMSPWPVAASGLALWIIDFHFTLDAEVFIVGTVTSVPCLHCLVWFLAYGRLSVNVKGKRREGTSILICLEKVYVLLRESKVIFWPTFSSRAISLNSCSRKAL